MNCFGYYAYPFNLYTLYTLNLSCSNKCSKATFSEVSLQLSSSDCPIHLRGVTILLSRRQRDIQSRPTHVFIVTNYRDCYRRLIEARNWHSISHTLRETCGNFLYASVLCKARYQLVLAVVERLQLLSFPLFGKRLTPLGTY